MTLEVSPEPSLFAHKVWQWMKLWVLKRTSFEHPKQKLKVMYKILNFLRSIFVRLSRPLILQQVLKSHELAQICTCTIYINYAVTQAMIPEFTFDIIGATSS